MSDTTKKRGHGGARKKVQPDNTNASAKELASMQAAFAALEPLDKDGRNRAFVWLHAALNVGWTAGR